MTTHYSTDANTGFLLLKEDLFTCTIPSSAPATVVVPSVLAIRPESGLALLLWVACWLARRDQLYG